MVFRQVAIGLSGSGKTTYCNGMSHFLTLIGSWAIIKDYDVYQKMYHYIDYNTMGVSHDTQLRATRLLTTIINGYEQTKRTEAINKDNKQMIFHYAYSVMRSRWERIESIFNSSNRFSLQSLGPLYCDFFRKVIRPSPAYAWVKCEREEEENCATVFERAGIIGQGGQRFGVSKRYIRLSLLKRDDTFIFLERRLQFLVCYNTTEQEFK